jgi:dTDP-4-amino-4,6-dideoxygalactose transaminase
MPELAINGGKPVRTAPFPAWPQWDDAERAGLLRVLESGRWWSTQGREVAAFEREWAAFVGVDHCVAVTNGTHAIEVALLAAGVGEGDEVIVTDYTFFASASAIVAVNAVPVLVDVDAATFCIDPSAVEAAITARTRAVIAVHLAGHPADLDRLVALCDRHALALIEDCAHAHGSSWRGRRVGSFGVAGTWSFQQSKLLTSGEGGAITLGDGAVAARARSFSDCGRRPGAWFYSHFVQGGNYRLSEWQGAVLRAQLKRFPAENRVRNDNALFLNEALRQIPGVTPQFRDPRTTSQGYYCYVVRLDATAFGASREAVRKALEAEGIPMTMSYPTVHGLDAFNDAESFAPRLRDRSRLPDVAALDLPRARAAAEETLWFRHQILMGSRDDAACLIEALDKIQRNLGELESRR